MLLKRCRGTASSMKFLPRLFGKMSVGLFSVGTGSSGNGLTAQGVMEYHLLGALITTALIWPWTSALSCEMTSMGAGRKEGEWLLSWEGELAGCM